MTEFLLQFTPCQLFNFALGCAFLISGLNFVRLKIYREQRYDSHDKLFLSMITFLATLMVTMWPNIMIKENLDYIAEKKNLNDTEYRVLLKNPELTLQYWKEIRQQKRGEYMQVERRMRQDLIEVKEK